MSRPMEAETVCQVAGLVIAWATLFAVLAVALLPAPESPMAAARAVCEAAPGHVLVVAQRGRLACLDGQWLE